MKNRLFLCVFLLFSLLLVSGCDAEVPLDQMENVASIVGKLDNTRSGMTNLRIRAFSAEEPSDFIVESVPDSNGYFQIILSEGSYVLRAYYVFEGSVVECEIYKENKSKLDTVFVDGKNITNVGIILMKPEIEQERSLPGMNYQSYSQIPSSLSNYNYYLNHPGYKLVAEASSKESVNNFAKFQVNKRGSILLFDIPEGAVIMDFHTTSVYSQTTTFVYELKGAQAINLNPDAYIFHVTTSAFPNNLSQPWRFLILEPIF